MNLDELMIPFHRLELVKALLDDSIDYLGAKGYFISVEQMKSVLDNLGCEWKSIEGKMNQAVPLKMNSESIEVLSVDNEDFSALIPEVLLEGVRTSGENLIRCIFEFQGESLKEVAERYGGRSAAANLSNILAKSNSELSTMRQSTMDRLAAALQCPVEWIENLKHPERMKNLLNQ